MTDVVDPARPHRSVLEIMELLTSNLGQLVVPDQPPADDAHRILRDALDDADHVTHALGALARGIRWADLTEDGPSYR